MRLDSRPSLPNHGGPVCEHVKKLEAGQWGRDNLCESEVEKLFVNLAEESSSKEDFNLLLWYLMQFNKL